MNIKHVLFLTLIVTPCFAADKEGSGVIMPSANTAILQTFLGLGLVVGIIYLLAWLLKRFNVSNLSQNKPITVVSAISLGTREKAILVNVKGQQLLLGVAPGRVSTLHVFDQTTEDLASGESNNEGVAVDKVSEPHKGMVSSLAANSASEFSKKLNDFLGTGNKS